MEFLLKPLEPQLRAVEAFVSDTCAYINASLALLLQAPASTNTNTSTSTRARHNMTSAGNGRPHSRELTPHDLLTSMQVHVFSTYEIRICYTYV